jgi:hypothetical protein
MSRKLLNYPDSLPRGVFDKSNKLWMSAVSEVCHAMRDDEIVQHMAIAAAGAPVEEYDPRIAALGIVNMQGAGFFMVDAKGNPYCVGGYAPDPYMPGVWQSWMAGTQAGWDAHWRDITKATRWLMGKLLDGDARRLETNCIASRTEAQAWYVDFLGMKPEGVRRAYCANGEDLHLFSITREDWHGRWE